LKAANNLHEFINLLESENELIRIKEPVNRDLEISEIYFRQIRSPGGGKALLFENVTGSKIPLLINAFGSHRRMELAFGGRKLDDVASEIRDLMGLLKLKKPDSLAQSARLLSKASRILRFPPKLRKWRKAPCQEIVLTGDQIRLSDLPVIKSWPKDADRFITMGLVLTRSLDGSSKNLGMYRMQLLDEKSTAMHWQIHKDGSHFFSEYRKAGRRMPVSVIIGADPAVIFSAIAPLPPNLYELFLAGFIRGRGVDLTRCITNNLEVPSEAEIVLEGYVDPEDFTDEGPFGDHTGYYTPVEKFPVFHITAITMRKNPVFSATVVGRSPQEDCYLAQATERLFLPMLQFLAPEVKDQMLPWDGCFHNCAVFSMTKEFPYQARKLMSHLWGFSQMSFAKMIVTVDAGVDLHDPARLLRHVLNQIDLSSDLYITEGILDQLDHSGLRPLYGGKLGIDATGHLEGEVRRSQTKKTGRSDATAIQKVLNKKGIKCTGAHVYGADLKNPVLIVSVSKKKPARVHERIAAALDLKRKSYGFTIVLCVPEQDDPSDASLVLWRFFGNTDPLRDLLTVNGPSGRIVLVDSTAKNIHDGYDRIWPEENLMDEATIKLVDSRWETMFGEKARPVSRP